VARSARNWGNRISHFLGKGGHDRDVPLSEKRLETLRVYWRWMKPKCYLFPGTVKNWRADVPLTTKVPWEACRLAAQRAGITKQISPHTLRPSTATHLLHAGVDIAVVALWRGHEHVQTTYLYLQADLTNKEQALGKLSPAGQSVPRFRPEDSKAQPFRAPTNGRSLADPIGYSASNLSISRIPTASQRLFVIH